MKSTQIYIYMSVLMGSRIKEVEKPASLNKLYVLSSNLGGDKANGAMRHRLVRAPFLEVTHFEERGKLFLF
tara:strand:+ start:199 stop:411 length:213 start_codon:yes stop_codon:yes gene_type:complete